MDTPAPSDEGEPSSKIPALLFFCLLIFLTSCDHDEIKIARQVNVADSSKWKMPPLAVKPKKLPKKKKIYLTFDDGPNKGTRNVLDIVKQENVPVTFFIVGEHVFASTGQSQVWDSLKAATNIELCNHSYTHAHNRYDKFYLKPGTVVRDMERTKETLLPDNQIVRAPGRNSWRIDSLHFTDIKKSRAAMDSLQKAGFIVMGWDLEWRYDHKTMQVKHTADELLQQVDSLFKKGKTMYPDNLVILAHDQVYTTAADSLQLREFIQKLKTRDDLELSLVSSYPAIRKPVTDTIKTILPPAPVIPRQTSDTL
jgi:peptidoglycan-N-acetylglucosamine deacetylase